MLHSSVVTVLFGLSSLPIYLTPVCNKDVGSFVTYPSLYSDLKVSDLNDPDSLCFLGPGDTRVVFRLIGDNREGGQRGSVTSGM